MPSTTLLFTDRPGFEPLWRPACEQQGLSVGTRAPESLAEIVEPGIAVVIDAAASAFTQEGDTGPDEDELLASVAFAKARGAVPVVALSGDATGLDDILDELCPGLIARRPDDVGRIATLLARRLDLHRAERFEFVTVSPASDELLAVLGDGTAALVPRPLDDTDDGSEIVSIELADDAQSARIGLAGGAEIDFTIDRVAVAPSRSHANGAANGVALDGPRLGARLRALRKAAGLTQAELARRTGIHRPNIARVEAGRHTPSLETLGRLATAIGVPTTRVLTED
jgi:DNA-binding XRE family transcriptional regulator